MSIIVNAVVEYNDYGFLVFAENYTGAYVRGKNESEALNKFNNEIRQYIRWSQKVDIGEDEEISIKIIDKVKSVNQVSNADTGIIFESERKPMTYQQYDKLKDLCVKSACDFQVLYNSINDKNSFVRKSKRTFYGSMPVTANQMYKHANLMLSNYAGEIGVTVINNPDISNNRKQFFNFIERYPTYLKNYIYRGNINELWTLKKVIRRLIWHDRIHAKALWRLGIKLEEKSMLNPFYFKEIN